MSDLYVRLVADLSQLSGGLARASRQVQDYGTASQRALAAAQKAQRDLAAAQAAAAGNATRLAQAQAGVGTAQQRLARLQQTGTASAADLAAATAAVATAQHRVQQAQQQGAQNTQRLSQAQRDLAAAQAAAAAAAQAQARSQRVSAGAAVAAGAAIGTLAGKIGGALVGAIKAGVGEALEFDKAMRNVNSISGLSEGALSGLGKQVLALSNTLPQSGVALAEGLYDVASSGFQGAAGLTVLKAAAVSASAGMTDTATSAQAITSVLNAYKMGAGEAADVSDILFSTVNLGVTTFGELAHNVGDYVGQAQALGVRFEETGAAIATMTLNGVTAAEAGTVLGSVLNALIKPNDELAAVLHAQGLASGTAAVKALGLRGVLDLVRTTTGGTAEGMSALFSDTTALRGALSLTSNGGAKYAEVAGKIEDQSARAGAAQRALAEQSKSASYQFEVLRNKAQNLVTGTWMKAMPALGRALADVNRHAGDLGQALGPALHDLGAAGGNLLAVAGALAHAFSPLIGALAQLGAGAAVGTFTALAQALSSVTGFAEHHTRVIQTLAVMYAATYVPAVLSAAGATATLVYVRLATWALMGASALSGLAVQVLALTAAQWRAAAAGAAMTGGVLLALGAVANGVLATKRGADEATAALHKITAGVDLSDPGGVSRGRQAILDYRDAQVAAERSGSTLAQVWHGLNGESLANEAAVRKADAALRTYDQTQVVANANVHTLGAALGLNRQQVVDLAKAHGIDLTQALGKVGPLMGAAAAESRQAASAMDAQKVAAGGLPSVLDSVATSLGTTALSAEELKKRNDELASTLGGFVEPMGVYTGLLETAKAAMQKQAEGVAAGTKTGKDSWQDYATSVKVSIKDYNDELTRQIKAQQDWEKNLTTIAGRVGPDAANALLALGREAAPLVAQFATGSTGELQRFATNAKALATTATAGHAAELERGFEKARIVAKIGSEKTAAGIAHALGVGVGEVAGIMQKYGIVIAAGVNPVLTALGGKPVNAVNTAAGVAAKQSHTSYADGGVEDHSAQIAPAGAWRVWAEPETGGEAYIPLAPQKRARSVSIWRETGRRLGQRFAAGGFSSPSDVPAVPSVAPYSGAVGRPGEAGMGAERQAALDWFAQQTGPGGEGGGTGGGGVVPARGGLAVAALVAFGHRLQAMGARVSEQSQFGGVHSVHAKNSKHYRDQALDVNTRAGTSKQEQAELAPMAALARSLGFGTIFMAPGHYNHLHVQMARGGVLGSAANPHVRDAGGPLLPGFTYNGTGAPEMVIPMAAGGITATGARPAAPSVATAAKALADAQAQARAATAAEKAHNAQLAEHNRLIAARNALSRAQAVLEDLQHDLTVVRTAAARADTLRQIAVQTGKVAEAQRKVNDAERGSGGRTGTGAVDRAKATLAAAKARADAAKKAAEAAKQHAADYAAAVDRQHSLEDNQYAMGARSAASYDALLAKRLAHEKKFSDEWVAIVRLRDQVRDDVEKAAQEKVQRQISLEDNMYAVGARTTAEHLADLDRRMKAEKQYSDEWTRLYQERKQITDAQAEDAKQAAAAVKQAEDDRIQVLRDAADKARQIADDAAGAQRDALAKLNDLLDQEAALRKQAAGAQATYDRAVTDGMARRAKAEATLNAGMLKAQNDLAAAQGRLVAGRGDALAAWVRLDQTAVVGWGNTVGQLLDNAKRQAEQFTEWADRLAEARARGVSEQVIASLGLDEGPQALGALRQFSTATQAEVDALNTAVAARSKAGMTQARAEQVAGVGQLGRDLVDAQQTYADTVLGLQEEYAAQVAALDADLEEARQQLLATQADLATQLAALGAEQGRSYGDAVAAGMRSTIPGILAAAQAVAAAQRGLEEAQASAAAAAAAVAAPAPAPAAAPAYSAPASYSAPAPVPGGSTAGVPAPTTPMTPLQQSAYVDVATLPKRTAANDALISGTPYSQLTARQIAYADMNGLTLQPMTYDVGGPLQPGYTLAYNGTGKTEHVLTAEQMANTGGPTTVGVQVFIGETELTDLVDVRIGSTLGARRTAAGIAGRR